MRSSGRGGSRGPNRPKREMHDSVCTLCGENTKVPFKPTPGKPIRCRDCMDKVKQGMATKEELANEREAIKKMRSKLEESMGMKLFIGRLPYELTEEDLSEAFSKHGKVESVHLAKDRDTGKSKGFAFVTYQSRKEGTTAVKEMNGSEINGRKIVVEESSSNGSGRDRRKSRR